MAARKPPPPATPVPQAPSPTPTPLPHWDGVFHRLFAHVVMVADLLRSYLAPDLRDALDLDRFEREAPLPLNVVQHSDKGHARTGDLFQPLFTTPQTGSGGGALLLLEFQASPDTTMSLRMMVYVGLGLQLLLALTRDRPEAFAAALAVLKATPTSLPPVVPVVLYHGEEPWGRQRSVRDNVRLSPTSSLEALQPDGRYVLIDARRDEPHTSDRGPCVLLFAMLRSLDTPALRSVAEELDTLLLRLEPSAPVAEDADPDDLLAQDGSLRGAFLLFILGLLRSRRYAAPYDVIQRVKGELPMITDTIDNVTTVERQQGLQQGLQQTLELVLSRPLTEAESTRLAAHLAAHGVDLELIRAMRSEPVELGAWLQPAAVNGTANGANGHEDG